MKYFTAALLILLSSPVFAGETNNSYENRLWLYLGGDAGYMFQDVSENKLNELNKHGYQFDLKALLSRSWSKTTLDGGLGFLFNDIEGESSSGLLRKDNVKTNGVFGELGLRYRLNQHWELGPLVHLIVGDDVGFNSTGSKKKMRSLGGLQLLYRPIHRWPMRFTASFMTDFDIEDRQNYLGLVGFQFGIPLLNFSQNQNRKLTKKSETVKRPKIYRKPAELSVPYKMQALRFGLNQYKLSASADAYFRELGAYLGDKISLWNNLRIEGHSDSTGAESFNRKLSKKRADSVVQALTSGGAPKARIKSVGYASDYPITSNSVDAQNRRVELAFDKVKNKKALESKIQRLQKKHFSKK